jgi:hypothetical protein
MLLHRKFEMIDNMWQILFAKDWLERSLFDQEEKVCSWIVFNQKQKLCNSVEYLVLV